ncbi:MAG: hypothetical protein K6A77_03205 [Clostridiales bacterium]|nr:hypothetical protein [Clostridiales bacterium]
MSSIINDRVCSPRFNKNPRFLIKNSFWPVVEKQPVFFYSPGQKSHRQQTGIIGLPNEGPELEMTFLAAPYED